MKLKIKITDKIIYAWWTVIFFIIGAGLFVSSLFNEKHIVPSAIIMILSYISHVEYKVELLKEKLNEPKPPQQD